MGFNSGFKGLRAPDRWHLLSWPYLQYYKSLLAKTTLQCTLEIDRRGLITFKSTLNKPDLRRPFQKTQKWYLHQLQPTPNSASSAYAERGRVKLKCDGTRWCMGGEVKGKMVNGVTSTLHTTSEHGVSSITTADAHTSAASSRLKPPRRFKWTRPFSRKTKSGFCACAITFRTQSTSDRAIAGLSYSRFKAIRHKYQCQLPSKGPLVIGRRVWIQRFLSGKLGQQQRRQPNTSKHSNQYQNKLRKGILVLTLADK